jgi:hypothetical protein
MEKKESPFKTVGKLWWSKKRDGTGFLSGVINLGVLGDYNIMVYQNIKKKKGSRDCDYNIVINTRNGAKPEETNDEFQLQPAEE